jgi:hypothetical protein
MGKVDSNLDFGSAAKGINHPTPTASGDLVNKAYADSIAAGLIPKPSVRAASTGANVTIASPGATLDGVSLNVGDRILLKDQTTTSQNGIWSWNGPTGALTRPSDFGSGSTQSVGVTVYVGEGALNIGSQYTLIESATGQSQITVDTTAETWTQTNGLGDVTVQAPITKNGNQIQLNSGNPLPMINGGTGASSVAGARVALAVAGVYAQNIGDGTSTSFNVNHGLNSTDIQVTIIDIASGSKEWVDWTVVDANHVTIGPFATAPAAASGSIPGGTGKRVVVSGI